MRNIGGEPIRCATDDDAGRVFGDDRRDLLRALVRLPRCTQREENCEAVPVRRLTFSCGLNEFNFNVMVEHRSRELK